jgi:hypothetical protein
MMALLLTATNLFANSTGVSVTTLGGGNPNVNPKYLGYEDGNTLHSALFHTPSGIALDSTGQYLYVADRDNNAIRYLDLMEGWTWTFDVTYTNLINKPIAVAVDTFDYVYVLNRGNVTNGSVVTFDKWGDAVVTNAVRLTNAAGMALDSVGNIYLTVQSNKLIRIAIGTTNQTTIATVTNVGTSLQGIVVKHNGLIAACDSGNNGIWLINPSATNSYSTLAGFHGAGDFNTNGNNIASSTTAKFNQPMCVTEAGDGTLVVSDYGNNRVKAVLTSGVVTNLYGVTSQYWGGSYPGWYDGTVYVPDSFAPNVQSRLPFGIAIASDGTVYTTEDYYHIIRHVIANFPPPLRPPAAPTDLTATATYGQVSLTWTASSGATNYNVKRSTSSGTETTITNVTSTSYTDTNVIDGTTYYYVVSALGAGGESANSSEVSATPLTPPPPAPRIGWFDYEGPTGEQTTVLHPVSTFTAYNDLLIAIDPTMIGISTYYITTNGPQPVLAVPSSTNGSTPPFYKDGLVYAQPLSVTTVPDLVIKAVNVGPGGSSPIVTAEFLFQVGNPTIIGNNAAQFTVSDITSNVVFWYTIDGTNPTNASPSIGPVTIPNGTSVTLSINASTNTLFQARAFRNGYSPSGIAVQSFSTNAFVPNSISFGFASGEASSDFVGSPGQTFYAPVTLSVLPDTTIYSLQFNLTVTNAGSTNSGPPIINKVFGFQSMLMKPIPGTTPIIYEAIPPAMFVSTNPVPNPITLDGLTNFSSLLVTDTNLNLLGVGWLERAGKTNLYDTTKQDLITYSMAHDVLHLSENGLVEVGGYAFWVPTTATNGQTYQIQIGRPSATSDGIGAPGSSVFIYVPTNGSLTAGAINSIKNVTMGQRKYLVGNVYPFRWFNAGDFGNTNLQNADVMQVFESAIYNWNYPPFGSDFFDAMDSCGTNLAYYDSNTGFYTNSPTAANLNNLFDGNDTTINNMAYGDGVLDVCDVYVTYRRSLDPSLTWFQRFWTNGFRVAETTSNVFNPNVVEQPLSSSSKLQPAISAGTSVTNQPQVNFSVSGTNIFQASPGQTLPIPITAAIFGNYPLRVLMLNLTVVPLDGSPALTTPVTFSASPALGTPYTTDQQGNGNYSAVWLDSTIAGLTGTASLGTLTVTIPANATSMSAYAIHFDHASASPNGVASFPKQTLTGLITLSSRTNSYYNDGIPDSWRLRWFGTIYNLLSVSTNCATSDGINNWQKYVAGVDPNTPNDFPSLNPKTPVPAGTTAAIHWPTVSGKQYVILRSSSLFPGNWSAIATNTGTGTDMEFDDTIAGQTRFYRVQILP